jgi:hypothetical protein
VQHGTKATTLGLAALAGALAVAALALGASAPRGIGRMSATPNILYAGSSRNELTFTFAADSSSLRGQTLVEFPRGWTAPQRTNPSGPGYVSLRAGQCATSTRIVSIGVRKVTVATTCARHQTFQLVYSNVTAPQLAADGYVFLTLTRSSAAGRKAKFRPLLPGKQPVIKVKGGPPVGLYVQTTSVATTGTAFSVTVRAIDAYGNNAYPYLGTVQLSSSDPAGTMPGPYSFVATDAAQHTFTGAILRTVGTQTITATDPVTGLHGTTPPIQVVPPS